MPVYFPGQAKNGDVTPNGAAASNGPGELRRSGAGVLNRARARTLKMTVVMVCVFIFCWTPYYVISMWWVVIHTLIELTNLLTLLHNFMPSFFCSPGFWWTRIHSASWTRGCNKYYTSSPAPTLSPIPLSMVSSI